MIANYHTHTARCLHAAGTEREYVERALQGGCRVLGFSDHTPYPFPAPYISGFRMRMDQLEGYVRTVLDLRAAYRGEIEIRLGLEVEYYPRYFEQLLRAVEGYLIEYFLLGQHYLQDEMGAPYSGALTRDPRILEGYCSQVIGGMETGCYSCLAHPDLINFHGDGALYEQQMRRLCREALRHGLPLEINFLGISESRSYPDERFWKIAGEEGCPVVFGCDAHTPAAVLNPEAERRAQELVRRYGLQRVEKLTLRAPV